MIIYKNVKLKKYNTFHLDYLADCMIRIKSEKEAISLFEGNRSWKKPLFILGAGSNLLFTNNFNGTLLRVELGGIKIEKNNNENIIVSAGAGVIWDNLVKWTVKKGFSGLENLSLIPGTVGASPVQNIGAYGVEVKDLIEKVRTVCVRDGSVQYFEKTECEFNYRNSIFKSAEKGKYLVTRVYYKLNLTPLPKLAYGSLREEVDKLGGVTTQNIRKAVINMRRNKLPDPQVIGNAGSFFKNPLVNSDLADRLKKEYPMMPLFKDKSGSIKLAAGWLIDQAGWKGKRSGDAGVHDKQALVLVNYGSATGNDIYSLSKEIENSVIQKFGIELEREVEIVGSI